MKLRIKGDSLRLRVSPSEVARLLQTGRVEDTIHLAPPEDAKLTYALEHAVAQPPLSLRYRPQEVAVVLSTAEARRWAEGEEVGIYGDIDAGGRKLALTVEKDFACLTASDKDNLDTFPNPLKGAVCRSGSSPPEDD